MTVEKIFKAFRTYCKAQGLKVIYGSEGDADCPYYSKDKKLIHLMNNDENVHSVREMIHEWTHSTGPITNRPVFNEYPYEELVAEMTAFKVLKHYDFYSVANRENYAWQFKHASYLDFWATQAISYKKKKEGNSSKTDKEHFDEIMDIVGGHIDIAVEMVTKMCEEVEA